MRTILVEVSPLLNGVPTTLRLSGSASSAATTQLNGYQWLPCITKRHSRSANWAKDGVLSTIDTSWGSIEFWLNKDFNNEGWTAYEWSGAQARIFVGEEGNAFTSYTQVFEGNVSSLDRTGNKATVALLGSESNLTVPILNQSYGGTGGADGMASMKGTLKPRAFGNCKTVAPVLVDGARYIYQVHGYRAVTSIPYVYEYAQALDSAKFKGDAATYADLAALTLQPAEWATCLAQGMFRLGGAPRQKISADVVVGSTDVASIARQMFAVAGIPNAKIGSLSQFGGVKWSLYLTDQAEVLETLKGMFFEAGGYIYADGTGTWQVGDYYAPQASIVLNEDRSTFPLVKSIKELSANGPVYKVNVGYDRCWDVHSESDVSPALSAISDAQIAASAEAAAARQAADQAASDAAVAKSRLDAIVSDGILDRSEKAQLVQTFSSEAAQQNGLQTQPTNVTVTTERSNLATAFANWKNYLEGLSPAYTDTTQNTPVDRATFDARASAYWLAKQTLLNKMAGVASTVAKWGGVTGTGKPEDNATVGAQLGTNLTGENGNALERDDVLNAAGTFSAALTCTFNDNTAQGFYAGGATISFANGVMTLTSTSTDPLLFVPLNNPGKQVSVIRMRLRAKADTQSWQGQVYFNTAGGITYSEAYTKKVPSPKFKKDEWQVIEWDMNYLTVGGSAYVDNTITSLRFDLSNASAETFEVDWVQIGERLNGTFGAPVGSNVGPYQVSDLVSKFTALDNGGFTDVTPPNTPTGLSVASVLTDAGTTLNISWTAVSATDLSGYVVAISEGGGSFYEYSTTSNSYSRTAVGRNVAISVKVLAFDKAGNRSGFSGTVAHTTARDTAPPAVPVLGTISPTYNTAQATWSNGSESDLDYAEVNLYNASDTLVKSTRVSAAKGGGSLILSPLAQATTYKVDLRLFDTSGNASGFSARTSFTTAGGVAASDFAPNVSPIQTVTSLPATAGYSGPSVVFNSSDKKLYRFANGSWTSGVDGADVAPNTLAYSNLLSKPTSLSDINGTQSLKLSGIKDGAGTVVDTRNDDQPPSYYYARQGETQEFKNGGFSGSGSSGYGHLVTVAQWGDPSGGPVKQTLQDSTSAIYERLSLNTVSWGAWGRNYNSVAKPKLGSDLLDSTGAVLTDASTLNKNQQWTDVGGTEKPSDNAGTSVTFYDPQNGYATRGNSFGKSQFNNSWQVNLWTRESYYGSAMVSGEFVGQDIFIGLSFNGQNIDNYGQLEYAIYARGDNQIDIYQSGTGIVTLAYSPGAGVYAITYDGVSIKYWRNNTLIYTHPGNPQPGWTMYAGFNAYAVGNGVKNIQFGSFTDNAWSSVGGPNRPADNATVGAPNGTYVGGTLAETVAGNANNPAAVINRNTVTIDGGKLTAGTVDTLQLKAGAVSTDKLLVGSMSYLNPDPGFRDNSFWVNNGVYNGSLGTSAGSVPAWYNSHGTDINDAMGTTNYCMLWEAYFGGTGRQHLISGRRNGIKGGTTYQLSALGRNAASQRIYVLCRMYDTNGTYIADAQLFWDASIGKDYKKTQFVAPPNATSYQFYVFNEAPGNNWGGNAEIADLQVTEAAGTTAIMDGAIVTKHMTANTIKGDVIEAGTLMADKLVANSITTGKLAVQNRPVSVVGINMRIENDNVVRWNAGKIIFPDNNGNYVTRSVVAGATGWGGWDKPVNFCYDSNGDNQGLGVYYSQDLPAYASQLPVAIWNNGKDLVMRAGTSTLINGDNIQTGTIAASKLIADSITANEIQSGAIGAAEIAAGAIVATKLAIGSTDSIVPDSDFRDPSWWNSGIPDGRLSVEDVAFSQFRRALAIRPNGGIDVFSPFFPVEPGATYKITMGVDCAADFNGIFRPLIHMPGVQWYSPKYGAGVDPSDVNPVLVFNAAGQSENIVKTFTNPNIVNVNQWQFRLMGSWTGTVRFAIKIVRVSDTTLIADGAITTPKIIVGSLDGDRIATNTLNANTIKAGSILAGSVVVGGAGALGDIATQAANAGNNAWWTVAGDRYAITNNKITKLTYNDWDYNCYTQDLFQGSCIMTGKLTSDGTFIGISDGRENGNYGNIDYAWHRSSDGNTYMFQSGANVGGIGSNGAVGADSVNFTVVYDGRTVRWYRNEFLHREVDAGPNRAFSGAVGIAAPGAYVERLSFQPGTDNSLTRADVTGKINAGTTTINGGKITTGSIGADQIAANSITASKLSINNRNISVIGCDFRYQDGRLWWSDGHILYTDDNGNSSSPYIPAASVTWNGGSYNYIVWDKGAGGFRQTPPDGWEPSQNNASNSVIMCTWRNGTNFNANYGGTIVSGDRIVTKSIGADQINVGSLSALSANIGSLVSYNGAGGRVERDGNGTRIYDNNGTLRSWSGF